MAHRISDTPLDPREHPDYTRRAVRPPDWSTFGNRTRLIYITDFSMDGSRLVRLGEALDLVKRHGLGDVYKLSYPVIYADNVEELAREFSKRDLFLFSLYGYVPGSGPGGLWRQYRAPAATLEAIERILGDHWLGMENGEQDGRYVGGFASQMTPRTASRLEQYLNFQKHFEKHGDDVGNRMSILVSLNFSHYFAREGVYTLNGAETGQALPNGQVYYAFIRGAGEQYGLPWIGNASVFNRWGYKGYGETPPGGMDVGPTKGTSLSLLKRLLYSHILYNSVAVGLDLFFFENDAVSRAWERPGALSPIGRIQQEAGRWLEREGQPGTMLRPVALLLDFLSGWSFPRHLYTSNVYRVWGNLPYEAGDYLTDGVLDLLYPRYQDSSYYHDESGFMSSTPYGDAADCILSDAEDWVLDRYELLVVAGKLSGQQEIRDKLDGYMKRGGKLVITAGSLAVLPGGLCDVSVGPALGHMESGSSVSMGAEAFAETAPFDLHELAAPDGARVLARCGDRAAAVELPWGDGLLTVLASPFGVGSEPAIGLPVTCDIDAPLPKPYPLLAHVRAVLDRALRPTVLFEAGEDLSLITCRRKPGEYTLGVANNTLRELPLRIVSQCGEIRSIDELRIDESEKSAVGYLPEGFESSPVGTSGEHTIAGGDVRVFRIHMEERHVEVIPHRRSAPRPRGRFLPIRGGESIKDAILARPTFFHHFDGCMVDWKLLHQRERRAIQAEAGWLARQKLRIAVDLSSGVNLYPDLRLVDNIPDEHAASLAAVRDVLDKMSLLGALDLLLPLHRLIENNMSVEDARRSMARTVGIVCTDAKAKGIRVHLRLAPDRPPKDIDDALAFVGETGSRDLRLAPSLASLVASDTEPSVLRAASDRIGLWLAATPRRDVGGQLWSTHSPLAGSGLEERIAECLAVAPEPPVVLDAVYDDQDQEYLDARFLARVTVADRAP